MIRSHLSLQGLYDTVNEQFSKIKDSRDPRKIEYKLADSLLAGLAVFTLKDDSLLKFEERANDPIAGANLKTILKTNKVPSDTQLRDIIDPVKPEDLRSAFDAVLRELQRGGELTDFMFLNHYAIALDGTGYFSSSKTHCPQCLTKKGANGEITYHHQILGASLVHPHLKQVIPLYPEPICNDDGDTKNDCERNASKRWVEKFRKKHPKMPVIILEDSLASNGPHLTMLQNNDCHYLSGVKDGDHKYLFQQFKINSKNKCTIHHQTIHRQGQKVFVYTVTKEYEFINGLELNKASGLKTNLVIFKETICDDKTGAKTKEKNFSWVTDLELTTQNIDHIVVLARRRWAIENEVFQTLKKVTDYNLEHNYGHGSQYLSTNFALLSFLALLIDQALELACTLFKELISKIKTRKSVWESMKRGFHLVKLRDWNHLLESILNPAIINNTA